MLYTAQILEADGSGFTKAVIRYGMACYKDAGWGAVVVREGCFNRHPDGRVEATVFYLTTGSNQTEIPKKAYDLVHDYDPEKEIVLSIMTADNQEVSLILKEGEMPF